MSSTLRQLRQLQEDEEEHARQELSLLSFTDALYATVTPEIDVLIVGAGLSGLTSAYKILKKEPSLRVLILEEMNSVGGALQFGFNRKWFTKDQYHIRTLLQDLGLEADANQFTQEHSDFEIPKKINNPKWELNNGFLSFLKRFEINRFIKEIDSASTFYRPGDYPKNENFTSAKLVIESKLFFTDSRNFFKSLLEIICGVPLDQIFYEEFLSICNGCGGVSSIIKNLMNPDEYNLYCNELITVLTQTINHLNGQIQTSTKIQEILHYKYYIIARDAQGVLYRCSVIILAIPWHFIESIKISPSLPADFRIPMKQNRLYITSFKARYTENFWKEKQFSKGCENLFLHSISLVGYEIGFNTFAGYIVHNNDLNQYDDSIPDEEKENEEIRYFKSFILSKLSQVYGSKMLEPIEYDENTCITESLINFPILRPWNRFIISSNCSATIYRGFMNGAVQSGLRSAIHALMILRPQTLQWKDIVGIQYATAVHSRVGRVDLHLNSLNLYNTIYYTIVISILAWAYYEREQLVRKWPSTKENVTTVLTNTSRLMKIPIRMGVLLINVAKTLAYPKEKIQIG